MSVVAAGDYETISPRDGVEVRSETIVSQPDGNSIKLQIITPAGRGPRPCVYYIHGGGMMALSCYDPNYAAWGRMIARQGVTVVMVDFRNALTPSSAPEVAHCRRSARKVMRYWNSLRNRCRLLKGCALHPPEVPL